MDWKDYYSHTLILFCIINANQLQAREISVFKSKEEMDAHPNWRSQRIPALHIRHLDDLKLLLNDFEVAENHRTLYGSSSLISWEGIGWTMWVKGNVDWQEVSERWGEKFDKNIFCQDFILDMDYNHTPNLNLTLEDCWKETKTVTDFLQEQGIPITVMYSGNRGWHIKIPAERIEESFGMKKKVLRKSEALKMEKSYVRIARNIQKMFDLKCMDTACLFRRQPCRLAYSIHSSGLVALPLTKDEFSNFFKLKDNGFFLPENVMTLNLYDKNTKKNRGTPEWQGDFKNIKRFFKAIDI